MEGGAKSMKEIRPTAVAGAFYPGEPAVLMHDIRAMLAAARPQTLANNVHIKALIVPHAGYVYSGPIAASAYAQLIPLRHKIRHVVLLGPVHRVPVRGLALPGTVDSFATPLGLIPLDKHAMERIAVLPQVVESAPAHAMEHSLEVQLPFLQLVLDDFTLLPLAVGDATPQAVAEVLEALWDDPDTLIVISSDLSHYLPYDVAKRTDHATAQSILDLASPISHEQACGGTPINGLLLAARRHHLTPQLLDLRNSGDTEGDRGRVVGYGAFAFYEREIDRVH
jgi:hypothetical protein